MTPGVIGLTLSNSHETTLRSLFFPQMAFLLSLTIKLINRYLCKQTGNSSDFKVGEHSFQVPGLNSPLLFTLRDRIKIRSPQN